MGKKRVIKKGGQDNTSRSAASQKTSKKKLDRGILYVEATYNNTKLLLTDPSGKAYAWSSSGSLGFSGSKKGTPFAASKVGELLADRALAMGLKDADVIIKGVGAGRESAMRAFSAKGINILSIKDRTPVPFNGPKPPKPRRV
ncbi:MAG TPA: 30S ribosomal protein S11 [Candidatus Paceibacterota bacterium]|jgi:small subunit ribosomal protein S11|nr:30S ribosomal protein S11 [Candidatus Paceibacterota bacterium]HOH11350.1 30S ribosomal protein S11 [Candidatus Paceibacterota bacterium]HOY10922.1 30S ribosomal protein S11 [Candidatus Paceibacterota bacterium]HPI24634.1 30S ribosomal protein S11 [Candidatus Paceibacterota bacterium]HPN89301.1 30S ribosomal protein S11 [Candidatus Paceibacterota bacterium]